MSLKKLTLTVRESRSRSRDRYTKSRLWKIRLLAAAWIIAPIIALAWNEFPTSAQSQSWSIEQITDTVGSSIFPELSMSSDGTRIVYSSTADPTGGNADGNQEIFAYSTATGATTQITNTNACQNSQPSISGDGNHVAFASTCFITDTGQYYPGAIELFEYDFTFSAFTRITNTVANITVFTNQLPAVNSDGSRITFISNADFTGSNGDHNYDLFIYDQPSGTIK
ncbi:MAG: TolB family protein [Pyrinomonadaceae bacterium]